MTETIEEIGEFEDDETSYYKIVNGETIKISPVELHSLWMQWVGMKGTERIVKDGLVRYIFPTLKASKID